MLNKIKILSLLIILGSSTAAFAQGQTKGRELMYTYIGPSASGFINNIQYRDWHYVTEATTRIQGYGFSGGITLALFSKYLAGDFSLHYMYNLNNSPLQHLSFSMAGKFLVRAKKVFIFAPGIGLYFETPPAKRGYLGGAGFHFPLAFIFNTSFDTKLYLEGFARYGWYELGEHSLKLSYGGSFGFLIKVGRI